MVVLIRMDQQVVVVVLGLVQEHQMQKVDCIVVVFLLR